MRKKSAKSVVFLEGLHDYIVNNPQFRAHTGDKPEAFIHAELRPLIIRYLEDYFRALGFKDAIAKANKSFYWEGQEGDFGRVRDTLFGSRNYPDFIITDPYLVAIEYKQSPNGPTVKRGVGQSIMHTLSGDFDFVYYLFHDESKDKRIERSVRHGVEKIVVDRMWTEFNLMIRFV